MSTHDTSPGVDIDAIHRRPYYAKGLDMQGRQPEAAEACTEVGEPEEASKWTICIGGLAWLVGTVVFWSVVAACAWSIFST